MLNKQLTHEEKKTLLNELLGFELINVDKDNNGEHWVIYDEEGMEFYGSDENWQFNFSTLGGIIHYIKFQSKKQGYFQAQYDIKKALGIYQNK